MKNTIVSRHHMCNAQLFTASYCKWFADHLKQIITKKAGIVVISGMQL